MTHNGWLDLNHREMLSEVMQRTSEEFSRSVARRRTVRDFSKRSIPDGVLENCVKAAATAPSGANRQPWHFCVVLDPVLKSEIRRAAENEERAFYSGRAPDEWLEALAPLATDENKPFLEEAPALIVIFAKNYGEGHNGEKVKNYYVTESVGIATGILITALHQCGLCCLTHTPSPMNFLRDVLARPQGERAFLILVVGYPASDATVPDISRKAFSEISTTY